MEVQQGALMSVQDLVHELATECGPASAEAYLGRCEVVSDIWDAITQIIEVQAHRISSSGFEITLVPSVGDKPPAVAASIAWGVGNGDQSPTPTKTTSGTTAVMTTSDLTEARRQLDRWGANLIKSSADVLNKWVEVLDSTYDSGIVDVSNSGQLFQLKAKYQNLKEEIDKRAPTFRDTYNKGYDFVNGHADFKEAQQLKEILDKLNDYWIRVTNVIIERHNILQDASHKYGEFRGKVI
ncbi:hypothetical protein AAG570_011444 [Ranatra chinensis]|uniref:Uncharacterized protein n=1 Tax=Ranatra chinensis TaxID=642074 RepID=A0ABD0YWW0_9HEMI